MQPGLLTQEDTQTPFWPPLAPMGKGKGTSDLETGEQTPFWPFLAKGKGKGVAPPQMERLVPLSVQVDRENAMWSMNTAVGTVSLIYM